MGVSIGQIPGGSSVLRVVSDARASRIPAQQIQPTTQNVGGQQGEFVQNSSRSNVAPVVEVGFGERAIGGSPAAALAVLDRTVESVRQNTPTIEDIQLGFRQRAEEARARVRIAFRDEALSRLTEGSSEQTGRLEESRSIETQGFLTALENVELAIQEEAIRFDGAPSVSNKGAPTFSFENSEPNSEAPEQRVERFDVTV